ncbi:C2H2 type zinc finger domain protein [Colletotrichum higginsianum IMI 349063]|uniref:C2H2 type zinc finger domain protein n=1 Tax=Colletotrichum higginsianum (strain IMI 349063) TaxID=759273 RepID=A0A1B7YTH4_COLHI|nr:C2H2 type zinc finger domain protein [Colletotrichum higginsianum IMI 349063]OBR15198.1 C2H2 type zinc finger domain protein [Colletotrichum higginsianum IMI 349063]
MSFITEHRPREILFRSALGLTATSYAEPRRSFIRTKRLQFFKEDTQVLRNEGMPCKTRQRNCVYVSTNQRRAKNFGEGVAWNVDQATDAHVTPESTGTHVHSSSYSDLLEHQGHFTSTEPSGCDGHPHNPDSYPSLLGSISHLGPQAFETSDSLLYDPTQWCFLTSENHNWLNGAVSDDVWKGATQIGDTFDTVQWSRKESDSLQERIPDSLLQTKARSAAPDIATNPQDAATDVDQGVTSTEVATPLLSDEAPRPNFTNHSELSATFQDALRKPAALGRDCGNNAASEVAKRRRQTRFVTDDLEGLSYIPRSSFLRKDPSINPDAWRLEDYEHVPNLNTDVYSFISTQFARLNADNSFHLPFTDEPFPSFEAINAFVQSYFEHYHPVFPLLHQASFDPKHSHWVLVIAVAATGCGFSVLGTTRTSFILQELLRRSINLYFELETEPDLKSELSIAQAILLSQIGLMFSGNMSFSEHAQKSMSLLATFCRKANYFTECPPVDLSSPTRRNDWSKWIYTECKRRLVHLSWLFDSQICAFFDLPPTIPTDLLRLPMPSVDSLWMARSSEEWNEELSELSNLGKPRSLREEVNSFYRTQKLPEATSELNTILLTLAVYRDAGSGRDTVSYLNLLRNDKCQNSPETPLGWVALQHNHLLSLLTHLSLRDLMVFSGWRVSGHEHKAACLRLASWLAQNPRKARLIIYHGAQLFSSIRDHPTQGHHEANSFLVATLGIWASTAVRTGDVCSNLGSEAGRTATPLLSNESSNFDDCSAENLRSRKTIRLDKPVPIDKVEPWISGASLYRPYLSGVGALTSQDVCSHLLEEGVRVLSSQSCWSIGLAISVVLRAHWTTKHKEQE